jgi:hypothetical protein
MKNTDEIMINDCVLTLENESAFYTYFYSPYMDNLKKKVDKDNYDNNKAVNGLQERIRAYFNSVKNMDICRYRYKYIPSYYSLNKQERILISKAILDCWEMDNLNN